MDGLLDSYAREGDGCTGTGHAFQAGGTVESHTTEEDRHGRHGCPNQRKCEQPAMLLLDRGAITYDTKVNEAAHPTLDVPLGWSESFLDSLLLCE